MKYLYKFLFMQKTRLNKLKGLTEGNTNEGSLEENSIWPLCMIAIGNLIVLTRAIGLYNVILTSTVKV